MASKQSFEIYAETVFDDIKQRGKAVSPEFCINTLELYMTKEVFRESMERACGINYMNEIMDDPTFDTAVSDYFKKLVNVYFEEHPVQETIEETPRTESATVTVEDESEENDETTDGSSIDVDDPVSPPTMASTIDMPPTVTVEEEEVKEAAPKAAPKPTSKGTASKPLKGAIEEPTLDKLIDYKALSIDMPSELLTAIDLLRKPHRAPQSKYMSERSGVKNDTETVWRLTRGKIQHTGSGEAKIMVNFYMEWIDVNREPARKETKQVKYESDASKSEYDDMSDHERLLIDALRAYKKVFKYDLDSMKTFNSDLLYDYSPFDFYGVIDTTLQLPIGPYAASFDYKSIDTFVHPEDGVMFSQLWMQTKRTLASVAYFKKLATATFSNRYSILGMIPDERLDKDWKDALDNLKEPKNDVLKKWKAILESEHCKNVIIHGYPCRKAFQLYMKKLLVESDSLKAYADELLPIGYLFGPFRIQIETPVKAKREAASTYINRYILAASDKEHRSWFNGNVDNEFITSYRDWVAAKLKNASNDDNA